jgi:hypothetical protein
MSSKTVHRPENWEQGMMPFINYDDLILLLLIVAKDWKLKYEEM